MEVSRIPGSLTTAQFEAQKAELLAAGKKEVVAYCTIGYRSSAYAAKLREQGFDAKNLEGSIVRWVSGPRAAEGAVGLEPRGCAVGLEPHTPACLPWLCG